MTVAALVESMRLKIVHMEITQEGKRGPLSMIVFWLPLQYLILGLGDGFTLVGLQEYFYDQVPDSMRSLGIALLSDHNWNRELFKHQNCRSNHRGKGDKTWIGKDLNVSRLYNFLLVASSIKWVDFMCLCVSGKEKYLQKCASKGC